jgi:phytoene dehydrogenase-like protein
MMQTYNAIVVGAGHNGLTCACYLARAGLRTLVLDQYHTVGGMATTESPPETQAQDCASLGQAEQQLVCR